MHKLKLTKGYAICRSINSYMAKCMPSAALVESDLTMFFDSLVDMNVVTNYTLTRNYDKVFIKFDIIHDKQYSVEMECNGINYKILFNEEDSSNSYVDAYDRAMKGI